MTVSRRSVLRYGTIAAAAGLVGALGWQFRPTTPADGPQDIPIGPGAGPSLLIVYGSMMGSTGGQAQWMADLAQSRGYRVALFPAETAPAPEAFDRVLVGSAIRAASWLDPVVEWVAAHAPAIKDRPHGLFQCSMTCAGMLLGNDGAPLNDAQRRELRQDCDALFAAAPTLAGTDVAYLPGRLEFSRLTPVLRLGYPFVAGSVMRGDYRDRAMAEAWARRRLAV